MNTTKYMTLTDIAEKMLQVGHDSLSKFAKKCANFPEPNRVTGKYNIVDVLKAIASRPNNGKMKERAQLILADVERIHASDGSEESDLKKTRGRPKGTIAPSKANREVSDTASTTMAPDIKAMLGKLMQMTINGDNNSYSELVGKFKTAVNNTILPTYMQCMMDGDNIAASAWIKLLGQAIHILGIAEERSLELEQKVGKLIPLEEAKTHFVRLSTNISRNFLALIHRKCFEYAAINSPEQLKSIMYEDFSEVLNAVAENPFADN